MVKYKLYKYVINSSSILTKCVNTKGPSSRVNLILGHTVYRAVHYLLIVPCKPNVIILPLIVVPSDYAYLDIIYYASTIDPVSYTHLTLPTICSV